MRAYIDLMEALEYSMLTENEQRAQFVLKNSGNKLEAKYRADVAANRVPDHIRQQIEGPQHEHEVTLDGDRLQHNIVEYIMQADPTPNKVYTLWIAMRYLKPVHNAADPNNPFPAENIEDINPTLSNTLATFARAAAARRVNGDINQYKTFADLFSAVEPFIVGDREVSGKEDRKKGRDTKTDVKVAKQWEDDPMLAHADVVYDDDAYMVLIPADAEGAAYFGKNTNWCTTTTMFHSYSDQGPLYIILRRKDGRRWQFHFESDSFMNEQDRPINLNDFLDENMTAVRAIGLDKFGGMLGKRLGGYGVPNYTLSIDHFPPETIAKLPDDVLARTVSTLRDIKALPEGRGNTKEFFLAVLGSAFTTGIQNSNDSDNNVRQIVAYYAKMFGDDHALFARACKDRPLLFKLLPEKLQTDEIKTAAAMGCSGYSGIAVAIPKPWNDTIEQRYWETRLSASAVSPADIPEKFLSDSVLEKALYHFPEEIPNYLDRLQRRPVIVNNLIRQAVMDEPSAAVGIMTQIPKKFKNKELATMLYNKAMKLTKKSDEADRDLYLKMLASFDLSLWPTKAPKLSQRMAIVNDDFMANPEQFHNTYDAALWVNYHPAKLSTLPKEFLDARVVSSALATLNPVTIKAKQEAEQRAYEKKNRYGRSRGMSSTPSTDKALNEILEPCDPSVLTPEMLFEGMKDKSYLAKGYEGIPDKYMSSDIQKWLVDLGELPLNHRHYPTEQITPETVAARFKTSVPIKVKDSDAKESWRRNTDIPNIKGMTEAWDALPDQLKSKETLIALINKGFDAMVRVVDKSMLDSEVFTAWVDHQSSYASGAKEEFTVFPKEAYTSAALATAVQKHIIDQVPAAFRDDSVIINLLRNWSSRKEVPWKEVTVPIFKQLQEISLSDAQAALRYNAPKNHAVCFDPDIAKRFLSKKKGAKDSEYSSGISDKELTGLYGPEHPERRKKWDQQCYDMAAGSVVPLSDIPKQFQSDAAKLQAIKTAPDDVLDIDNPVEWLKKNAGKTLDGAVSVRLLSKGIVNHKGGWINAQQLNRETVEHSPGSYTLVNLDPGQAMIFFDGNDKPIDALVTYDTLPKQETNQAYHVPSRDSNMLASAYGPRKGGEGYGGHRPNGLAEFKDYRLLLGTALERNPKFCAKLPSEGVNNLSQLAIFETNGKNKDEKTIAPIESMPRQRIEGGTLTWCDPDSYHARGRTYIFDGDAPKVLGVISLDRIGYNSDKGQRFEGVSFFAGAAMPQLLSLSSDIAKFLKLEFVLSGQNPTFKDSVLHDKLGIRGPGKGEWWSFLEEKVMESGDLTVWRNAGRVAVTDNIHGVIATAKWSKAGGIKIDSVHDEALREKIERVLAAVSSKF